MGFTRRGGWTPPADEFTSLQRPPGAPGLPWQGKTRMNGSQGPRAALSPFLKPIQAWPCKPGPALRVSTRGIKAGSRHPVGR